MEMVKISLKNCYGIGRLDYTFDFSDHKPYAIYAPNGSMKSSFARTLMDVSMERASSDLLFPQRKTKRVVVDKSGVPISAGDVFVIEPYNEAFSSDRASLLMVNADLKSKFDSAVIAMEDAKERLLKSLQRLSGLRRRKVTPESELLDAFGGTSFYEVIVSLSLESPSSEVDALAEVLYGDVFNEKTLAFFESGAIANDLTYYMEIYQELVGASPVLSQNFNHYHAETIKKNLNQNNFFEARHTVRLYNGEGHDEYTSGDALSQRLEEEKERVLSDARLRSRFESIEEKLRNQDLRRLRDALAENPFLVARLTDYQGLRRDFWRAYLGQCRELMAEVASAFESNRAVINEATDAAKRERTDWEAVVDVFNARFSVPFRLTVDNQEDVILRDATPKVSFVFDDHDERVALADQASLLRVLSQGERRALYLLNVLFELRGRAASAGSTLVIVDDIADSFDYRNKYAIIEYLREQVSRHGFRMVFLSHNYDFHRAVGSRVRVPRGKRLFAERDGREITLTNERYQNNPFSHWKKHLDKERFRLASIPFVRNLAEYCGRSDEEALLTALLHIKPRTRSISVDVLMGAFSRVVVGLKDIAASDRLVIDEIYETAETIGADNATRVDLESKIVLAIAIRLLAEDFIIAKLADQTFVNGITKNQTRKLVEEYRKQFPSEITIHSVLDRVNLMTPENIHLNAFMYEPILDMGIDNLRMLYSEVRALTP